jgi:hypothetical protein
MKKKIAIAALMTLAPMSMAMAAGPNSVGCGVGTIIWNGQSGVAPQVLAATTNGTLGNQTFGISTGTLGCAQNGTVSNPVRVSMFIDTNLDKLAADMAVGQGETLDSMANLMGVTEADKPAFFQTTKEHFAEIISSERVSTADLMASLKNVLAANDALAQYSRQI